MLDESPFGDPVLKGFVQMAGLSYVGIRGVWLRMVGQVSWEVSRNPFPYRPLSVLAMFVYPFFLSMWLLSYHLSLIFALLFFVLVLPSSFLSFKNITSL